MLIVVSLTDRTPPKKSGRSVIGIKSSLTENRSNSIVEPSCKIPVSREPSTASNESPSMAMPLTAKSDPRNQMSPGLKNWSSNVPPLIVVVPSLVKNWPNSPPLMVTSLPSLGLNVEPKVPSLITTMEPDSASKLIPRSPPLMVTLLPSCASKPSMVASLIVRVEPTPALVLVPNVPESMVVVPLKSALFPNVASLTETTEPVRKSGAAMKFPPVMLTMPEESTPVSYTHLTLPTTPYV